MTGATGLAIAGAMLAGGWTIAAAVKGRPDTLTIAAFAPPPGEASWAARRERDEAWRVAVAANMPVPEPMRLASADDNIVTGSLGTRPSAQIAVASAIPANVASAPYEPEPPTISKPRPHIAALAPVALAPAVSPVQTTTAANTPPPPPAQAAPALNGVPLPPARPKFAALSPPDAPTDDRERYARAAVYDIAAQAVYLPSGEVLEAHSGLGNFMDNPGSSRHKNRGVTPPNAYKLGERTELFHGVRAIRLIPENEDAMYGRDGILAHTYMLGPSGQSNGCVSFRDYPKFLNAFLRGEFDRMIVVTHLAKPPMYARRNGRSASAL